jgi:FtsH-binding integral membrane protein
VNKKIKIFSSVLLTFFAFAFTASMSLGAVPGAVTNVGPKSPTDVFNIVNRIAGWFQAIVLVIAIIMIIYAGFVWMTAAGDEEKLGKARKTLIWGLVGIGIALFAYVAQRFIANML